MTAPTAQLAAVAYAVTEGLRLADFMPHGCVSLGYFAQKSLEAAGLVVAVMPKKSASIRLTRGGLKQVDLDITVGIFKPLVGTDIEIDQQVNEMLLLSQKIEDYFEINTLPGDRKESQVAATTDATGDMDFDPASLLEKREFTAFLTLTFRGTRQPA